MPLNNLLSQIEISFFPSLSLFLKIGNADNSINNDSSGPGNPVPMFLVSFPASLIEVEEPAISLTIWKNQYTVPNINFSLILSPIKYKSSSSNFTTINSPLEFVPYTFLVN